MNGQRIPLEIARKASRVQPAPLRTLGMLDAKPGRGFIDSFFDDGVEYVGPIKCESPDAEIGADLYRCEGKPVVVASLRNGDPTAWKCVTATFTGVELTALAMVDLSTGVVYTVDDLDMSFLLPFTGDRENIFSRVFRLPLRAAPVMLLERSLVPLAFDWRAMKPAEIVDALYRPGMTNHKTQPSPAPWMEMETSDFLPFIDAYGQFKYRDWPGKTHSDRELRARISEEEADLAAHPGPSGRDRFGGWADGPQLEATGRFRIAKHEGKWWFVDPDGHLFWSVGAIRVTPSSAMTPLNGGPSAPRRYGRPMPPRHCFFEDLPDADSPFAEFYKTHDELLLDAFLKRGETEWYDFSSANLRRKYGENYKAVFSDLAHRRLGSWGFNTISNGSDMAICLEDRTPYVERVECKSRYIEASPDVWWKFRDPFDPSFTENVVKSLEEHGAEGHDPWCVGFYVDNEISWGDGLTDIARWTLASPPDQPARIAFMRFLSEKGVHPSEVSFRELRDFTDVLIDAYFRKTREALKSFDPALLYLGCRFAGAPANVVEICSRHCDAVSYNLYSRDVRDWRLPMDIDRPVLISEFHFGALDRGPFGRSLIDCHTQDGRAAAITRYLRGAVCNPQVIGAHWHQFSDQATTGRFDGEYFQVGLTDVCDTPYAETVAAFREFADELYPSRQLWA